VQALRVGAHQEHSMVQIKLIEPTLPTTEGA
jgi:hypothetical protein